MYVQIVFGLIKEAGLAKTALLDNLPMPAHRKVSIDGIHKFSNTNKPFEQTEGGICLGNRDVKLCILSCNNARWKL